MDLTPIVNQIYKPLWYLVPLSVLIVLFRTAWFKGVAGEFIVNLSARLFLDKEKYHLIKNVTLPTADGSTQVDHIIVSRYGVFVVETKNMKGWIFGGANQKTWTQTIYRRSSKFQNPLRQNYKHTKVLESLLGLSEEQVFSLVVFVGNSTFKTEMPKNVTYGGGYLRFIKSKVQPLLTDAEVKEITARIEAGRLVPSGKTNRKHVKHVRTIVANKENNQTCPRCGGVMVLRETKRGKMPAVRFWGCSSFPKCRAIVNIT